MAALASLCCCLAGAAGGCGGAGQDADTTSSSSSTAPDITGTYDAVWGEVSGCDGAPAALLGWVDGPLVVSGAPDALTFDFGEIALPGEIDEAFSLSFAGEGSFDGSAISVTGAGLAYIDADLGRWVLEGDLDMDASEAAGACTATGTLVATSSGAR